jgi:hypothetical protein
MASHLFLGFLLLADGAHQQEQFFEERIRPVLSEHCFDCHGEDDMGELRLDSREALIRGGSTGPAVIPGDPEGSLLIRAIRHEADLAMPWNGDPLATDEIRDLEEWVRQGAYWPTERSTDRQDSGAPREPSSFWSFQPLRAPDRPVVQEKSWPRTDLDYFVLAQLEEVGLEPSSPADRHTLLRRLSLDLIGLPPTVEEIDGFIGDTSAAPHERLVERLLASPHYGERWARHWLDVVRYGEDDQRSLAENPLGREGYPRAHVYRDWVVDAFNGDLPYDEFVRAQLAADLMQDSDSPSSPAALGLLGTGPWFYDNAEPAIARADERHDRVDVTTRGFLGLTVACARCHDHKYDPITMQDYYALAGVFAATQYHEYPLGGQEELEAYESKKEQLDRAREQLGEYLNYEEEQLARVLTWQISRYMLAAWRINGEPEEEIDKVLAEERLDQETLQRWIRFLTRPPDHYPYLQSWQEMIGSGGTREEAEQLAGEFQDKVLEVLTRNEELEDQNEYIIANGSPPPDERDSIPLPNDFESVFDFHDLELEIQPREEINLILDLYAVDLSEGTESREPGLLEFEGWSLERRLSPTASEHVHRLRQHIEQLEQDLPESPFAMGVQDLPEEDIQDLALHVRGDPRNLGEPVARRFVRALTRGLEEESFDPGSGRSQLAECIATHPLTVRVLVNRIWRWHFGTGLVATPGNFGASGERPSHPPLLEYLAHWFVEQGYSVKALHREILKSATYRQNSRPQEHALQTDPENRLYWRFSPRRLQAESIRDALLVASGGLDRKLGGPPLDLQDPENGRRTIYSKISRCNLDPFLQIFDFPDPTIPCHKRFTTTVPQQGLYFLNSPFVDRQTAALAERFRADPDNWERSIGQVYLTLFGREATANEVDLGQEFLEAEGDSWPVYLRGLLCSNEFRFFH